MGRVEGKVAIVTGGARGQGAAHVRLLVEEGAKVVFTDILEDEGRNLEAELGGNAAFLKHDVTHAAGWAAAVEEAEGRFGPVTVLVNNAGIASPSLLSQLTEEEYRRIIDINQTAAFLGMKAVLPSMRSAGGGSIINISSAAGMLGVPNIAYTASKFALRGMTKAAAIELGPLNIRVNTVIPGPINTAMLPPNMADEAPVPLGRVAEPIEVSYMVLFLASDEARYSTGGDFAVDGGITAQMAPIPREYFAPNMS